ncbi:hypothetical protein LCGC14_2548900 [marine sediment metagenome]|uniref:Methyltransferase FkbM domain-containing protein n=1 Tax=marine sediment metagenome TaxID=412755 RepID=A0A0F9ANB9_9ZZZZ
MKYYIDIGAYDGELLSEIIDKFPIYDRYIAFESVPELCNRIKKRFKNSEKVSVIQKAVSTIDLKDQKFYVCYCAERGGCKGKGKEIGTGSSLLKTKGTGNLNKKVFIRVETIDFSKYIVSNFEKEDDIILKIDIEGKEYDVLEHMIETGSIFYINKIYCEWHYHKIKKHWDNYHNIKLKNKKRHDKLIKKLNNLGFKLTGKNTVDEMDYIIKVWRKDN